MQPPQDRRVRRTRAALQQALQALVLEKRYESITITEILDRADVGRSTFYAHFTDKDDLLLSSLEHIGAELDLNAGPDGALNLAPLFTHADTHIQLYQALSRGPAGRLFLRALGEHLTDRVRRTLPADDDPRYDIRARYDAAGIVAALVWWLHHTNVMTAEHAADMTQQLRASGPDSLRSTINAV